MNPHVICHDVIVRYRESLPVDSPEQLDYFLDFAPNLGLLSIASFLPAHWEVHYLEEDYATTAELSADYDLVCISALNVQARRAYALADGYRARGVTVVIGGLHPSALPAEAALHADVVVAGEGELAFAEFLDDFIRDPHLSRGVTRSFYQARELVDLATLPSPRYDLIRQHKCYNKAPVMATRGCPHGCDFCCLKQVYGPGFRHKHPDQVVGEIELLRAHWPDPYIQFADENMLCDRRFARELLPSLSRTGVQWECSCDVGVVDDPELLDLLASSGCRQLIIGFESLRGESLGEVDGWKQGRVEGYARAIEAIQSRGIAVLGCFVVGFDHDDADSFIELENFITTTGLFDLDLAVLTPMPGTALYKRLKDQGRILSENWDHYDWFHVNFSPRNFSAEELQEGVERLYHEFNSPEVLRRRSAHFPRLASRMGISLPVERK